MYIVLKIFITALTVIAIGEIAKRSSLLAGIIASVPLTSLLAFLWIYYETHDISLIKDLSKNIIMSCVKNFYLKLVKEIKEFLSSMAK